MQCAHDEQSTLHSSAKDPNSQLANKYTELPHSVCIKVWSPVETLPVGSCIFISDDYTRFSCQIYRG